MIRSTGAAVAAALLAGGTALAADLPVRKGPPPALPAPPPVFTWTGVNFGTLTGYVISDRQTVRTIGNNNGAGGLTNTQLNVAQGRRPAAFRNEQDGFTSIGGNIGYDYQFTPGNGIVVGAAADATYVDVFRNRSYLGPALAANNFTPDPSAFRQGLDWLGTVRGRIGYGYDRFLIYGTGGFAYGNTFYRANFFNPVGTLAYTGRYDDISTGYAYGGGIEYAIPTDSIFARFNLLSLIGISSQAVTAKFEYLHYDLGSKNVVVAATGATAATGSYTSNFRTEGNLFRGGLTYRFNSFGSIFGGL